MNITHFYLTLKVMAGGGRKTGVGEVGKEFTFVENPNVIIYQDHKK